MHTSAGIAEEEIERTGRSGHPLFAAGETAMAATDIRAIRHKGRRGDRMGNLVGIENDYNRRYPVAEFEAWVRETLWYPDVISES
jgi:hypothetical protein